MILNDLSSRSYKDLSQYPIFPWIIKDYLSKTLDLNSIENYRDLEKCMGQLGSSSRQQYFSTKYKELLQIKDTPAYFYGSHYSNPAIVIYYLLRLDPFNKAHLALQGNKYDVADRLFNNLAMTFQQTQEDNQDVRELIPQFYYMPEMFLNLNHYDFGINQLNQPVNHVQLPTYCNGNPYHFVLLMRQALESNHVSEHLHNWIDLIWGYKQKGFQAIKAHNLFFHLTYEQKQLNQIQKMDQQQKISYYTQINNFGQTPSQLFKEPHPKRKP